MTELQDKIRQHWAPRADLDFIHRQLNRRGGGGERTAAALASLDQLHAGQLEATALLVEWAGLKREERILDIGAGLGGTARWLAQALGCRVTALELSSQLDACARSLTDRLGLGDAVMHRCGDFLDLGGDDEYDVVLLQHVDMHLPDKIKAYGRCFKLLKSGGRSRVLWHDWFAGERGELRPPVPWVAEGENISFLSREERFRADLGDVGLRLTGFKELMAETTRWYADSERKLKRVLDKVEGPGRARFERLLAEVTGVLANLDEGRLVPFFGEARRV